MAEYVRMPKAHYEAACNSIRAKTGKADKIKSGDMSAEIESITGGGGSSADVRYVTFMSYDGSVEYGKIPVAIGYDCPTPKFDTPTRESTAQYNYTFYGWATTPNGGADANWNKTITADKTVYANFTSAFRYYTITYLDSDGSTVLKTESLAYGSTPKYTPEKDGYNFDGWVPSLASVTGNATYTANWKEASFYSLSWSEIAQIASSGKAAEKFNVGDEKEITLTDGTVMKCCIAGFNRDTLSDDSGTAPITVFMKNVYPVKKSFGSAVTQTNSSDPYHRSEFGQYITELYNLLPADLKANVKMVKKQCDGEKSGTIDHDYYTWAFSNTELGAGIGAGHVYEYFDTKTLSSDEQKARRKLTTPTGGSASYWVRKHTVWNGYMTYCSTLGALSNTNRFSNTATHYCHFGFCI